MALPQSAYKDREFLAVIGDEVYILHHLFTTKTNVKQGLSNRHPISRRRHSQKNFLVVDSRTETSTIEGAFDSFTRERKDIAIVLINQHIADKIRGRVDQYNEAFPSLLEIPSKDHPYDPEKDSVMKRVRKLFGE
ncbi:H(+)-transporting V1 sector ATPase subunit F [Vermiconidia calcicola]|uniref:H(+)-transporting V1 sector ATPase subunit F n=1 Tax=Vermiconidia calcicola TaxID=1690605 RepID=A0ACC3MX36_9PEZI|nr:H(+)-transporting V1 sector ATPase subunit F [Vermiconidia calcicola]